MSTDKKNKVFCIGFHKTGTSSIGHALKLLGYRVKNYSPEILEAIKNNDFDQVGKLVHQFDAFQDNPWPLIYKELDQRFPKSKFILTYRPVDKWINSAVKHFGSQKETEMRKWIYGTGNPQDNEEIYTKKYSQHLEEVTQYFATRPADYLVLDWSKGDGWEKLCPFLGVPLMQEPFPHTNSVKHRSLLGRIELKLKKLLAK